MELYGNDEKDALFQIESRRGYIELNIPLDLLLNTKHFIATKQ